MPSRPTRPQSPTGRPRTPSRPPGRRWGWPGRCPGTEPRSATAVFCKIRRRGPSSPRHVVHPVSVDPVRLAVGRGGSLAVQRVGGVQECPVDLGCGGDVQAVARAAAHLSAFLQRLPFGLAETLALVEMAGDLAGHLDPDWRLGFAGAGGYRLLGSAGQQVGHSGADRDPAHLMLAGQRRNAGPGAERVPDLVDGAESGYLGAATGSDALR